MKLAVIGFGNAGGKVTDAILAFQAESDRDIVQTTLAINSAEVDLARLEEVPEDKKLLIGQTDTRVKGTGVGADPDLGAEITRQDSTELARALGKVALYEVDAFLIIAGLGGGTGCGGAPILAQRIADRHQIPVYCLGILPSKAEGGRAVFNAARSIKELGGVVDNLILFDNDAWRESDSVHGTFERTNREIAKRIVTLLSSGEMDGSMISENAMDASDIRRTMNTGGVSTLAYAEASLDAGTQSSGLIDRLRGNGHGNGDTDPARKVSGLVRQAVNSRLTCPADVSSAERSLIVVSGPPGQCSRKGLEHSREWLESRTESAEVLAGDDPRPEMDRLAAVVLLSNVTDVPTIDQLKEKAVQAHENIEAQETSRKSGIDSLLSDDEDVLEPL